MRRATQRAAQPTHSTNAERPRNRTLSILREIIVHEISWKRKNNAPNRLSCLFTRMNSPYFDFRHFIHDIGNRDSSRLPSPIKSLAKPSGDRNGTIRNGTLSAYSPDGFRSFFRDWFHGYDHGEICT